MLKQTGKRAWVEDSGSHHGSGSGVRGGDLGGPSPARPASYEHTGLLNSLVDRAINKQSAPYDLPKARPSNMRLLGDSQI